MQIIGLWGYLSVWKRLNCKIKPKYIWILQSNPEWIIGDSVGWTTRVYTDFRSERRSSIPRMEQHLLPSFPSRHLLLSLGFSLEFSQLNSPAPAGFAFSLFVSLSLPLWYLSDFRACALAPARFLLCFSAIGGLEFSLDVLLPYDSLLFAMV